MSTDFARRLKRPSWRDPRLGVGVVLVGLSVAAGTWVVAAAGRTEEVWAASGVITPGESLADQLVPVAVTPELVGRYLPAGTEPEGTVDRVVGKGELVPRAAVVPREEIALRAVVVGAGTSLAAGVVEGARVDVWFNPAVRASQEDDQGRADLVAEDVIVARVSQEDSPFAGGEHGAVELLLEPADLPAAMQAMAGDGSIVIVPRAAG